MKHFIPFSRKRRQWLRAWTSAHRAVGAERQRWMRKLRRLAHALRPQFTVPQWARVAAALVALAAAPEAAEAQVFTTPNNNGFGLSTISANTLVLPSFVDMDNDGDLDLMATDLYGSGVYFVPNTGSASAPVFGFPQPQPFGLTDTNMFYCGYTDLDNDGDIDVLGYRFDYYGASSGFYYFQNTGTAAAPAFGTPQVNPFGLNGALPSAVLAVGRFADLDNDGDDDYIAASFYGGGFRYFQNTGTPAAPQFAAPVNNPFGLTSAGLGDIAFVEAVDIDLDGDLDVVSAEYDYGNWSVYINAGTATAPSFAAPLINPYGLTAGGEFPLMDFADLDDDGDFDLFAFNYNGQAKYYQNNDPRASVDEVNPLVGLAPNPASDRFVLDFGTAANWSVSVINTAGQVVWTSKAEGTARVNVPTTDWAPGVYQVRATSEQGTQAGRVVVRP
jgi:hypothetical protein